MPYSDFHNQLDVNATKTAIYITPIMSAKSHRYELKLVTT